jgi:transposase
VKPYRKSNKNDYLDAEAIAEAVKRNNMRFVPIKTEDQLDLQGLHRVRERLVHNRTEVINQIRGFLLERGITFNRGPLNLRKELPSLLEDAEQQLTPSLRRLLDHLWREWQYLDRQIDQIAGAIDTVAECDEACRRLRKIPGVGPLVSTATVAAVGNGAAFKRGRDFAASGWDWCRSSTRPVAKRSCWASPSVATAICARCSCMEHDSCCYG